MRYQMEGLNKCIVTAEVGGVVTHLDPSCKKDEAPCWVQVRLTVLDLLFPYPGVAAGDVVYYCETGGPELEEEWIDLESYFNGWPGANGVVQLGALHEGTKTECRSGTPGTANAFGSMGVWFVGGSSDGLLEVPAGACGYWGGPLSISWAELTAIRDMLPPLPEEIHEPDPPNAPFEEWMAECERIVTETLPEGRIGDRTDCAPVKGE
jgi:hypothetical protein